MPSSRSRTGSRPLTVAFVPTGMKAGVGTSPCAVRRTPARASPSVGGDREAHGTDPPRSRHGPRATRALFRASLEGGWWAGVPRRSTREPLRARASRRRTSRSGSAPRSRAGTARRVSSTPAKAMTSASSVERGRWKFVTSASTRRKSKPGVTNRLVRPCERRAARERLEHADGRRPDGRRPARPPRIRSQAAALDAVALAVELVLGERLGGDRPEGVEADVERDALDVEAARAGPA